ncbi:hypothetical protein ABIA31_009131 [Catenulispora sp. MAP5-51]|uniref:DUF6065 family protein n=1 Tax=Catenulispora sp. MAP5-51 TaxID=3156298 RepID=UPI003513F5E4
MPEQTEMPENLELPEGSGDDSLPLIAYRVSRTHLDITAAPIRREWMDATSERFVNRCLPLLIANQSGWWLINSETFVARWDGGDNVSSLHIEYEGVARHHEASSHFGYGIVTWRVPALIRTPPGWNLLVRGPANLPKDGAWPLEGVVETDWAVATFTMNWKLTRPDADIEFRAGEPFAMIVPQRRGDLELFEPTWVPMEAMPEESAYRAWTASRFDFLVGRELPGADPNGPQWQRDYMAGTAPEGGRFPEHQRRLRLREFTPEPVGAAEPPPAPSCGRPPVPHGDR